MPFFLSGRYSAVKSAQEIVRYLRVHLEKAGHQQREPQDRTHHECRLGWADDDARLPSAGRDFQGIFQFTASQESVHGTG